MLCGFILLVYSRPSGSEVECHYRCSGADITLVEQFGSWEGMKRRNPLSAVITVNWRDNARDSLEEVGYIVGVLSVFRPPHLFSGDTNADHNNSDRQKRERKLTKERSSTPSKCR